MKNITEFKDNCCGCGECVNVCPKNAITMQFNSEGFLYPKVDNSLCVNCGLCVKRCTFNMPNDLNGQYETPLSYIVKHNSQKVREESRSGGVFTALSDIILNNGGVVYGCRLYDNVIARHARATTKEERDFFRGSKYIQSQTQDVFKNIQEDLNNGLYVVFSGTSCQVNAVKDYVKENKNKQNLFLVDIVCHGAPSPKVWQDYVSFVEKLYKKKSIEVDFRDKKNFGWAEHKESIFFKDNKFSSNYYTTLFYDHKILRKDCFNCIYHKITHPGDLTIADAWGVTKANPEFDDNYGVSLVLINNEKGKSWFAESQKDLTVKDVDLSQYLQPPLKDNWEMPSDREDFWQYYNTNKFENVLIKYAGYKKPIGFFKKVKIKCKKLIKKLIRR